MKIWEAMWEKLSPGQIKDLAAGVRESAQQGSRQHFVEVLGYDYVATQHVLARWLEKEARRRSRRKQWEPDRSR